MDSSSVLNPVGYGKPVQESHTAVAIAEPVMDIIAFPGGKQRDRNEYRTVRIDPQVDTMIPMALRHVIDATRFQEWLNDIKAYQSPYFLYAR